MSIVDLTRRSTRSIARCVIPLATIVAAALGVTPAFGETPRAAWSIRSIAAPTHLAPGDESGNAVYRVLATDIGSVSASNAPITIGDTIDTAHGVSVQSVELHWWEYPLGGGQTANLGFFCSVAPIECTLPAWFVNGYGFAAGDTLEMVIHVSVSPSASGTAENVAHVTGGEAGEASTSEQTPITSEPAPFEITDFSFGMDGTDGASYAQAGGHPYAVTTTLDYSTQTMVRAPALHVPDENVKDVVVDLPLGMVGDPLATPRCPLSALQSDETGLSARCPRNTKIGEVVLGEPAGFVSSQFTQFTGNNVTSLYNLTPEEGHAAEFGFIYAGSIAAHMYASIVSSLDGYMLRITTPDIPSEFLLGAIGYTTGFSLTLFGDPARHDQSGYEAPFFRLPTTCSGNGQTVTIHLDTWTRQGRISPDGTPDFSDPSWLSAQTSLPRTTACDLLSFKPTVKVQADTSEAESPTGLRFDLDVPQTRQSDPVLATPDLRKAVVTLPLGMTVSPAAADGLEGCSETQLGIENGVPSNSTPACPEASKIGTVEVETPLLEKRLEGSVYVASQEANPFKSLLAVYLVIDDPATGVRIKLPGDVSLSEQTGRITVTFDNNPQLPFSSLKLRFKNGSRAPVVTPAACGTYTMTSSMTPWSAPDSGMPATPSDSLAVTSGPDGTPCGPRGFAPSLVTGTTSNQAASFSSFTMTMSRSDADQNLGGISVTMPPGLTGVLSNVPLCGEPRAQAGECSQASQIGVTSEAAGAGSTPLWLTGVRGGRVYLTGPYKGAPFGLSIVVPTEAGPFNLGNIVARAAIDVDPHTSQVTVTSDPLPTMLRGVPLDVRTINVTIDRSSFILNPTNCSVMSIAGRLASSEGASASVSSRFEVANCARLPFKPVFSALTNAHHTRDGGDSLHVVVRSAAGQANLAAVHVELPKVLPSRLSTINQACPEATFAANPATCPAGSRVGTVSVQTPILSVSLTGPAYFVSHGGARFPELIFVLQGEGVMVELNGETFISNKGITSSTFKTLPDLPITRVDVVLPAGRNSVLTGNGDLCAQRLIMPTTLTGQNGAVLKRNAPLAVAGCRPELMVLRHSVKGGTATIVVKTPFAGRLVASAKGLSRAVKQLHKAGTATLKLTLTKAQRALLRRHPGRRLRVRIQLRLTPKHAHSLSSGVTVLMN